MREMMNTGVVWCPTIPVNWSIEKVKHNFYISKSKASISNPTVLKLARAGVQIRDISNNEGQLAASYDDYNPVRYGDLLLNPMDLYSGANCNMSEIEGVISPAYANLRSTKDLNPKYYDYYFKVQYWTMAMFAHGKGVSFDNRWTINAEGILNYEIPVPTKEEQNLIVDIVGSKCEQVDNLIVNQEAQIEKLKQYKQSLITEVVTKGLNPNVEMKDSGVSWIGMMPKHWKHFQLKNAAILKTGHTPPTVDVCNFGGDINWYTPGDFTSDTVSDSLRTITEYALVNEGITLFPKNTTLLIGIGGTAGKVCKITVPGYSNQQITAIIANCDVNPDFLFYEMIVAKQYLKDNAMYTTLPIINNGYLGSLRFILPTTVEQKEIVEYLDNKCSKIDKLIEIKQSKIAKLNEYKKSLIYEYVTGKKEVY